MKIRRRFSIFLLSTALAAAQAPTPAIYAPPIAQASPIDLTFDFSAGPAKPGATLVAPTAVYTDDAGYGYEPGATVSNGDTGATTTSAKPFLFSANVPEGNFNIKLIFGDSAVATTTGSRANTAPVRACLQANGQVRWA